MSTPGNTLPGGKKHQPFVPETMEMKEFTLRAVLLGLGMTVVLGAANAYLGLRAGITIAATYPAAVIGMAVLRIWNGSVLEENIARTSGTIGEGIAAGAIFTIPAFLMAKAWPGGTGTATGLRLQMTRLRRRIAELQLEVRSVRGKGYVLQNQPAAVDGP